MFGYSLNYLIDTKEAVIVDVEAIHAALNQVTLAVLLMLDTPAHGQL